MLEQDIKVSCYESFLKISGEVPAISGGSKWLLTNNNGALDSVQGTVLKVQ